MRLRPQPAATRTPAAPAAAPTRHAPEAANTNKTPATVPQTIIASPPVREANPTLAAAALMSDRSRFAGKRPLWAIVGALNIAVCLLGATIHFTNRTLTRRAAELERTIAAKRFSSIVGSIISPDGGTRYVLLNSPHASTVAAGGVVARDTRTGGVRWWVDEEGGIKSTAPAVSRDGRYLAFVVTRALSYTATAVDNFPGIHVTSVRVRDARTGRPAFTFDLPPGVVIRSLDFSPDGNVIAAVGSDGLRLLQLREPAFTTATISFAPYTAFPNYEVVWARFAAEEYTLLIGSRERTAPPATGAGGAQVIAMELQAGYDAPHTIGTVPERGATALSKDRARVVVADFVEGSATLYDVRSGSPLATSPMPTSVTAAGNTVSFSHDDSEVMIGHVVDGDTRTWRWRWQDKGTPDSLPTRGSTDGRTRGKQDAPPPAPNRTP